MSAAAPASQAVRRALGAGAAYFALVFGAGVLLGIVRTSAVAPRIGPAWAVLLELPVILAFAWLVCGQLVRWLAVPPHRHARLLMGGFALLLLLAAELALSVLILGRTPGEHFALYTTPPALLGLTAQLAFAALPWLQAAVRRR